MRINKLVVVPLLFITSIGCTGQPQIPQLPTAVTAPASSALPSVGPTATTPLPDTEATDPPREPSTGIEETATPDFTALDYKRQSYTSPDNTWNVLVQLALPGSAGARGGDVYYQKMIVDEVNGDRLWTVIDEWSNWGLGYTVPRPFHWSRDGSAMYYTNAPVVDGCGLFVNGSDLVRVDLETGEAKQIVPDVGLWLSLALDEQTVAYIGYGPRGLVVRDPEGNEREHPLTLSTPYQAGNILWSPDQTALVLTVAHNPCAGGTAEATSILLIDAATLEETVILNQDERLLQTSEWNEPGRVLLTDKNGDRFWLDVETGRVTPA